MSLMNREAIIQAVLTKLGRARIADNPQNFTITQFAFCDDEINYNLYKTFGLNTTAEAGNWIEKIPIFEPNSNETQGLRYKLISRPRGAILQPELEISPTFALMDYQTSLVISFFTKNADTNSNDSTYGYEVRIADPRLATFIGIAKDSTTMSPAMWPQSSEAYLMNKKQTNTSINTANASSLGTPTYINNKVIDYEASEEQQTIVPPPYTLPNLPQEKVIRNLIALQIITNVDIRNLTNVNGTINMAAVSTNLQQIATNIRIIGMESGQEANFTLTVKQPEIGRIITPPATNTGQSSI